MQEIRKGGREARRALRAAPLAANQRPVWPGMEGGLYRPLADPDVRRVHAAALDVLAEIGMADAPSSGVELLTSAGAELQTNGRITFSRALIEDMIAGAGRYFVLYGQEPRHDLEPWGRRVYFGTAGAAVYMVDARTGEYRDSTTRDQYDIARTVDALEHVHFYQRSIVCRDLADPFEMDFNTCYASVAGTAKHVGTSWGDPAHMPASLEMLHLIAGGEAKWRARPFVSQSNCFVVPPLRFAQDSCRCLEVAVRAGMPVFLVSAGQAGATSPAAIAGSLVQEIAECLAGLFYVNAVKKGAPAIFGPFCFVSDLRTGAMSGGSPEQALLSAAAAQVAQFYELTCGTPSGMTDSKMPDVQAGYEKAYNHALVGNAGANLCYESAGMMASLLGFSLEQLIIDNDIIGATQRTIRGIEVTDGALSVETIRATCLGGPNHFLGSEQTLARMQRDYLYPAVGDRTSPKEWVEQGRPTALDKAAAKLKAILASHYPDHIPPHINQAIRDRFPVRLPREAMRGA
ncbi:MAG: trimethylamine methyltransferase family protein [Rhizobiales bacterium]|nr:trimethylamine methyltransferase family protein [Hyphomicrobiales bacterium]MBI3672437.1 trimethylamine methyltransferase family protein [Hyphomicrobiales bacterium]